MNVEAGTVEANAEEVDPVGSNAPGETGDAATFHLTNGIDRILVVTGRSYLDHDVCVGVDGNQIKLSTIDLNIGANDIKTVVCQEPGSQPLPKLPKFSTA